MTLCGKRVFTDDQVNMKSLGRVLLQYDCAHFFFLKVQFGHGDGGTGRWPREDWNYPSTGQKMKIASKESDMKQIPPHGTQKEPIQPAS